MTPVKITKALALRLLKEAVEKKGADYVDPNSRAHDGDGCTYANGSKPGCIVGHVLYAIGVKPKTLRELDAIVWGGSVQRVEGGLTERGVTMTSGALSVLTAAQHKQDTGETWGEALTAACKA